jgi:hypothetical protein
LLSLLISTLNTTKFLIHAIIRPHTHTHTRADTRFPV